MTIGIAPQFQQGKCDVCGKKLEIRVVFDDEKKLTAFICAECATSSTLSAGEIIEKYGKKGRLKWTPDMADKDHFPPPKAIFKKGS